MLILYLYAFPPLHTLLSILPTDQEIAHHWSGNPHSWDSIHKHQRKPQRLLVKLLTNLLKTEQHCVHKATHPIRVSFLVFVLPNIFHINSFRSQNVTEQFTIINLWPLLHLVNPSLVRYMVWIGFYSIWIQPPGIFFLYLLINLLLWKLHRRYKFVRTKCSGNKLGLSAGLFESSKWQKILERGNSPAEEVLVLKELPPLVEASDMIFYLNQS